MTRAEALNFIRSRSEDQEFAISFTKADGSLRLMRAAYGYNDGLRLNIPMAHPKKKPEDVIVVYDLDKKEYRSFKEEKLVGIDTGDGQGWQKVE